MGVLTWKRINEDQTYYLARDKDEWVSEVEKARDFDTADEALAYWSRVEYFKLGEMRAPRGRDPIDNTFTVGVAMI